MRWLEDMSPTRFALLVAGVFAVLTAWAWAYAAPRSPEPDFRDDSSEPVIVPDPTFPRVGMRR